MASTEHSSGSIDPARAAESNTANIIAIFAIFLVISLAFVGLRLYSRIIITKSKGSDDLFIVLSELCAITSFVLYCLQAQHGLGRHKDTISEGDMRAFNEIGFGISITVNSNAFTFLKFSIGLCLLRLRAGVGRWYNWTIWVALVIVGIWGILGPLSFILHCRPLAGHWDKTIGAKCYPFPLYIKFGVASTTYGLVTNSLFAVLPIPVIWKLNMKRKTRIYLVAILSVGWIAVVTGIVKATYQYDQLKDNDTTFHSFYHIWNYIQLNLAIAAACAPMLRPIFGRTLGLEQSKQAYPTNENRNRRQPLRRKQIHDTMLTVELETVDGGIDYASDIDNMKVQDPERGTNVYRCDTSRDASGSEEVILQGKTHMSPNEKKYPSQTHGHSLPEPSHFGHHNERLHPSYPPQHWRRQEQHQLTPETQRGIVKTVEYSVNRA